MTTDPLSSRCSNPGFYDRWTCPACYHELGNVGEGDHGCPACGARVHCTLDYEPVCRSDFIPEDQTDDQEN
ncbi:putative amidophosphoribosyltransferase [Labrenzia sp. MBR-25]